MFRMRVCKALVSTRGQDAGANIGRKADGPQGEGQEAPSQTGVVPAGRSLIARRRPA
jgi:hypothetical protein